MRAGTAESAASFQTRLAEQEARNRALQKRVDELEAVVAGLRKQMEALSSRNKDGVTALEEAEAVRDDLDTHLQEAERWPVLGGYYDFEYWNDDRSNSPGSFRQHDLTLLLSHEVEDFRAFGEIEFEYGTRFVGAGGNALQEARGEVKLEQVWGERVFSDAFTLRGGLLLTPGYWNVNHWPHLVHSTRRPLMVRNVFPESVVGVLAYGTRRWQDLGLTYQVYAANGSSANVAKADDNEHKAVGGRLSADLGRRGPFETLDLGISGYADDVPGAGHTRVWGVDAQAEAGGFELLTEFAKRYAREDRTGFYVQPSLRLSERVCAFYRFDLLDVMGGDKAREHTVGVDLRPLADVVGLRLKLELFRSLHSAGEDYSGLATSFVMGF